MKYKPGESGNTNGRPKGSQNKNSKLVKLLDSHAEEIVLKLVELAKQGDASAIKLCLERLIPKLKEQRIYVEMPESGVDTLDNLLQFGSTVLEAVANGDLTPEQGQSVTSMITSNCKIIETNELAVRMAEIEHVLKKRRG